MYTILINNFIKSYSFFILQRLQSLVQGNIFVEKVTMVDLGFPIPWRWAYLMKVIPEIRRAH